MKLKRQNFLSFLEGTSVIALEIALETIASELTDLQLPLLRSCWHWSEQRQARSRMWLSLSCANYVVLNAIAIWDRIRDFRYTHASDYQ